MSGAGIMRAGNRWGYTVGPDEIAEIIRGAAEDARCLQGPLHHRHDEPAIEVAFGIRDGKPHATISAEYDPARDGTILDCLDSILAEGAGREYAQAVRDVFATAAVRAAAAFWGRECFLRSIALHPGDALGLVSWVSGELGEGREVAEVAAALAGALNSAAEDRGNPKNWIRFIAKRSGNVS